jgi:DNA primase
MNTQEILGRYVGMCHKALLENKQVISLLKQHGLYEQYLFENYSLGFSNGSITKLIDENKTLAIELERLGIVATGKDIFRNSVTIPIYDEQNAIVNIVGINPYPNAKQTLTMLNSDGIFNHAFLKNAKECILVEHPFQALLLIQTDCPNTTFLFGDDQKYSLFITAYHIRRVHFTFEGKMRLFYELTKSGVST